MRARRGWPILGAGLVVVALLVLASPLALPRAAPPPPVGEAYARTLGWAVVTRWVAAALVLAAGGAFAWAVRREGARARRLLVPFSILCLLAALVLLTPAVGARVHDGIRGRYLDGVLLREDPEVSFVRPPPAGETARAFVGERTFDDLRQPLDVGRVPLARGDEWRVALRVEGQAWQGDALPTLSPGEAQACVVREVVDDRGFAASPAIVVWWTCVARDDGVARPSIALPQPADGEGRVVVEVLPVVALAVEGSLRLWSAGVLLAGAAFAAVGAWMAPRRPNAA